MNCFRTCGKFKPAEGYVDSIIPCLNADFHRDKEISECKNYDERSSSPIKIIDKKVNKIHKELSDIWNLIKEL